MTHQPTLSLPAPAKLNLFLHITGRRTDGYHLLQSLFALLDYGDTLHLQQAEQLSLHCDHPAVPLDDSNLILRAAQLLQQESGYRGGARIVLDKRLPMGGGVGGGSSNAATALLGLNRLWQLQLPLQRLAELGLQLGADVPIFVHGKTAWAEGVGEQIRPCQLAENHFLVVHPGIFVSTAQVFSDQQLTRDTPISKLPASPDAVLTGDFHNDCEAVTQRLFPEIGTTLEWLRHNTGNARMTGTGACCFARLADAREGQQLLTQLPQHWTGFVARSCNTSPLHEALA